VIPRIFFEIDGDDERYSLRKPFVLDGYLCATDRRILVRRPDAGLSAEEVRPYLPHGRKLPDMRYFEVYWTARRNSPVALVKGCEPVTVCQHCAPGWQQTYPLSPVTNRYCTECDGDGWYPNLTPIPHGDVFLAARFVALLERHGVQEVEPIAWHLRQPISGGAPVYFWTPDFEGLLMPMIPLTKEQVA
jgi:hypothetical protein